jgi:hypothetical protein
MLSSHIEDIITAIKAMPNSLWRNKALSHAHDALAAIVMLETTMYASGVLNKHTEALNGQVCICRPGIVDNKCLVHGGRN